MAPLANESELFKELKLKLEENGDEKDTFLECIEIASKYDKKERLFVLYRLNYLRDNSTGNDKVDAITKLIELLMKKDREYGFYIAVIEASLNL